MCWCDAAGRSYCYHLKVFYSMVLVFLTLLSGCLAVAEAEAEAEQTQAQTVPKNILPGPTAPLAGTLCQCHALWDPPWACSSQLATPHYGKTAPCTAFTQSTHTLPFPLPPHTKIKTLPVLHPLLPPECLYSSCCNLELKNKSTPFHQSELIIQQRWIVNL